MTPTDIRSRCTTKSSPPAASDRESAKAQRAARSWAERSYHNLVYFHEVDKAGQFAAWEQPDLFAKEICAAFRPLRQPAGYHRTRGAGRWQGAIA